MKEKACQKLYNSITNINETFIEEAQLEERLLGYPLKRAKNIRTKKQLLFAAFIIPVFILCGFGYAAYVYWGVDSANGIHFDRLTQPFGTISSDKKFLEESKDTLFEKSTLIKNDSNVYANNVVNYTLDGSEISAMYFSPNYMVIFTQESNHGWILKDGENLTLDFLLDSRQSLTLEIGYILNGTYYPLSLTKGMHFSDTINVPQDGEYYFCVTNHSSNNAVIVEGSILTEHID